MAGYTRLVGIELTDVKNVKQGAIDFRSSVTGIYGQNGSGKTTAITALQVVRTLLSGASLANDDSFVGFIRQKAETAKITATFAIRNGIADYTVILENAGDGLCRVSEEILALKDGDERRRILFDHEGKSGDFGSRNYTTHPLSSWRSLRTVRQAIGNRLSEEETLSWSQSRSYLFSAVFRDMLDALSSWYEQAENVSKSRHAAFDNILDPLRAITKELHEYAEDKMRIVTTREGASVCFGYSPVYYKDNAEGLIDVGRPVVVPAGMRDTIDLMVRQANIVMPQLVPDLKLECDMRDDETEDGKPGIKVFLRSHRGNVIIPFWAESEGIRRIVGILTLLVRMFNEPGMMVAIDEIDDGVFENLLGELLETLDQRGEGQLLFTAHNLRALEILGRDSIVFSTTDPDNRFTRPQGVRGSNNLRDMYFRAINTVHEGAQLADKVHQADIALALIEAGEAA